MPEDYEPRRIPHRISPCCSSDRRPRWLGRRRSIRNKFDPCSRPPARPIRGRPALKARSSRGTSPRRFTRPSEPSAPPSVTSATRPTPSEPSGSCRAELGDDESAIEAPWRAARFLDLKRDDKGYAGYDDFLIAQARSSGSTGRSSGIADPGAGAPPALAGCRPRPRGRRPARPDHECSTTLGRAEAARPHVARAMKLAGDLERRLADRRRLGSRPARWKARSETPRSRSNGSPTPSDALRLSRAQPPRSAWMQTDLGPRRLLILLGRPDLALPRFEEAVRPSTSTSRTAARSPRTSRRSPGSSFEAGRVEEAHARRPGNPSTRRRTPMTDAREVDARVRLAQARGPGNDWTAASVTPRRGRAI